MTVPRPRATGIAAMAAAAGISAWLIATHHEGPAIATAEQGTSPARTVPAETGPQGVLTERALSAKAAGVGHTVFWAGPQRGRRYELVQAGSGAVAVHYVSPAGDTELSVATIPLVGAYARTRELASQPTAVSKRLPGGGIAWYPADRDGVAYVAYPGPDFVAEVDTAAPEQARRVAFSGRVQAVP